MDRPSSSGFLHLVSMEHDTSILFQLSYPDEVLVPAKNFFQLHQIL